MRILDCRLNEVLYESASTRVFRGLHQPSGRKIVVKQARAARTSITARLRREYRLAQGIPGTAVVEPIAFCEEQSTEEPPAIIYADSGGVSLANHLTTALDVPDFLKLACQLAEILQIVHENQIVHQDIKPANIIINPSSGEVRLTDFGIAVQNDGGMVPSLRMRGTLAYMAPEQSGRMNRAIDHRADLYSLGITCYEALTGQLPFEASEDTLEMIHRHLAVRPVDPNLLRPEIPEPISAIVMKLLAKDAEDRYQSAAGLRQDLEECRRQWQAHGSIADIEIGRGDVSDTFLVSAKTFGRSRERARILEVFRRVLQGHREVCFLRGFSGIGKSSVALGIQDAVLESRAYFVSGKFDQYQAGIPYSAILRAFRSLLIEILKEEPAQIEAFRFDLADALGQNGAVITDVIPELERIIGAQPEVSAVAPEEAENRFISTFYKFVRALIREERPLVLFLDDLQWADIASLRLVRVLLSGSEIRNLLVLGAYRDNEVGPEHPLSEAIDQLSTRDLAPTIIDIGPLGPEEVNELIAATLKASTDRTLELANFVYQKTGGNPFFVREFLLNLHREGHIRADYESRAWTWDARAISALPAPDQIGALMAQKIAEQGPENRAALQLAACIGAHFEINLVQRVLGKSEVEIEEIFRPALREGLISPLLAGSQDPVTEPEATLDGADQNLSYQFQHDRIQQAAYDSLQSAERERLHREIARQRVAMAREAGEALEDHIFSIIHHLDASESLPFEAEGERLLAASHYAMAGRKALDSAAYQAAAEALSRGIQLLGANPWQDSPDAARNLYELSAEAEHLCSRNEHCIELIQEILANESDAVRRIAAYEINLRALTALGVINQVVDVGLSALASLGYHLPANPGPARALWTILKTQSFVRRRGPDSIITGPLMKSPGMIGAMRILALLASGAFKTRPNLYAVAMCKYAELSYRGGRSSASAYGLVSLSVLLVSIGQFKMGERLSRIALQIVNEQDDMAAKTYFAHGTFVSHWIEDVAPGCASLRVGQRLGFSSGDIEYGGYCAFFGNVHSIYARGRLESAEQELAANYELSRNFRNENSLLVTRIYYQFVRNLRERFPDSARIHGEIFDSVADFEKLRHLGFNTEMGIYDSAQALLYFLNGKLALALEAIESAVAKKRFFRAMYFVSFTSYMRVVLHFASINSESSFVQRRQTSLRMWPELRRFALLAKQNPAIYLHKYLLLKAERARVLNRTEQASYLYNRAIAEANQNEYLFDEALACDLAASFYIDLGNVRAAQGYIRDAHRLYSDWGAVSRVQRFEDEYPALFESGQQRQGRVTLENTIAFATRSESGDLDIETVTKAVQLLFAGQSASTVLSEYLRLSVENAGAHRGCVLLHRGEELWVEALLDLDEQEPGLLARPFESYNAVPRDILHYVLHSGQSVVLGNAPEEGSFTTDAYVRRTRCKSILAAPVMYDSKVRGVLYLENAMAANVFTRPRLQVLGVLSHQAAVSLENARLYEHMQQEIGEKTRELLHLKMARDRMDPHFLFNSLNMVQALMRTNPEQANQALLVLAELYGHLTEIRKAEQVPFEQEWRFSEEYLKLMQLRYHKSLEVKINRPPELPQIQIPPLTLQPIIENSFKHGFADLSDRMQLSVTLSVTDDQIEVDLRDNGKGYQRPIRDTDTLHSIRERLRHYLAEARIETENLAVGSRTLVVIPLRGAK